MGGSKEEWGVSVGAWGGSLSSWRLEVLEDWGYVAREGFSWCDCGSCGFLPLRCQKTGQGFWVFGGLGQVLGEGMEGLRKGGVGGIVKGEGKRGRVQVEHVVEFRAMRRPKLMEHIERPRAFTLNTT